MNFQSKSVMKYFLIRIKVRGRQRSSVSQVIYISFKDHHHLRTLGFHSQVLFSLQWHSINLVSKISSCLWINSVSISYNYNNCNIIKNIYSYYYQCVLYVLKLWVTFKNMKNTTIWQIPKWTYINIMLINNSTAKNISW